jgi:hypothetical protein
MNFIKQAAAVKKIMARERLIMHMKIKKTI